MKAIKLNQNLTLVEQAIPRPTAEVNEPESINHMWIYDRSGSMSGLLRGLVEDLISKLPTLKTGDTLSVAWFSGQGSFNWILKGFKVTGPKDIDNLSATLRKNNSTMGTTCFSEVLHSADQVVTDLQAFNPDFALCFFTDGYPVVSNYQAEIDSIKSAIAKIQGRLSSVLVVGYGHYYNKELLASMASQFGGTLTHSARLDEFSASLTEFVGAARQYGVKQAVEPEVKSEHGVYFSINGSQVTAYAPNDKGQIMFAPELKGRNSLFILTKAAPAKTEQLDTDDASVQRAVYAAARLLTQTCRSHLAMEALGAIGDVALVTAVNNAYTNDEYGRAESKIGQALRSPKHRFTAGRNTNFLPDADAYCFLHAAKTLMGDESAKFYPLHPDFTYNRIGQKQVDKPGTAKFTNAENPACDLENLVWNEEFLNLSLLVKIPGTVELDDRAAKFGFAKNYPTFKFRSYSFVKDGNINLPEVPISMSKATFAEFLAQGLIDAGTTWEDGKAIIVHFDRIPVMNRGIAEGKTSAKALCKLAIRELESKAKIKVLKAVKAELEANGAKSLAGKSALTADQTAYLKEFSIGYNGFSPNQDELPPTDKYFAKEFTIKVKGCSTLPKVDDVRKKLKDGKKLTVTDSLIAEGLKLAESKDAPSKRLTEIAGKLAVLQAENRTIRGKMQETKFAVLLGKRWFDEFTSRDQNTLEVDGYACTLSLREVEVPI